MRRSQYFIWLCIFITGMTLVVFCIIITTRKSLGIVVALFEEASRAIFYRPMVLLQPVYTLTCIALASAYYLAATVYLFSVRKVVIDDDSFVFYYEDDQFPDGRLFAALFFCGLWTVEFLQSCEKVVISDVIGNWYFSSEDERDDFHLCPTWDATYRLVLYHLGSVACGSLLSAIVQFVRWIITFIQYQLKDAENPALEFLFKCLQCCLGMLQKLVDWVSKNAYISVALFGDSFCRGAQRSLSLLVENSKHTAVLVFVCKALLTLCKVFTMMLTTFGVYYYFEVYAKDADKDDQASKVGLFVPLTMCFFVSWMISKNILEVFELCIETMLICFCYDQRNNNGHDRPYYSSVKLIKLMRDKERFFSRRPPAGDGDDDSKAASNAPDEKSQHTEVIEVSEKPQEPED